MSKITQIEAEAKTIKEAIEKALNMLGARKEQVDVKVLAEEQRGLFNMGGAKPARVRVTLKNT